MHAGKCAKKVNMLLNDENMFWDKVTVRFYSVCGGQGNRWSSAMQRNHIQQQCNTLY